MAILRNLLYSRHSSLPPLRSSSLIPPWSSGSVTPPAQQLPFFYLEAYRVQNDWGTGFTSSSMESLVYLLVEVFGTKSSRQPEDKITGIGSKNFAGQSLGVIVSGASLMSTPWFLEPWILAIRQKEPHIYGHWFRAYTASCKTLPQPHKILLSSCSWVFKRPFYCSIKTIASGWPGKWSDQWIPKYGPIAALHFLWSYFLDQKQGCADYHDMVRFSVRPWMGVLAEALHVGNSNLYAECLSFFPGTQHMKSVLPSKTVNHHKHSCLTRWSYQKSTKTVESLWKK